MHEATSSFEMPTCFAKFKLQLSNKPFMLFSLSIKRTTSQHAPFHHLLLHSSTHLDNMFALTQSCNFFFHFHISCELHLVYLSSVNDHNKIKTARTKAKNSKITAFSFTTTTTIARYLLTPSKQTNTHTDIEHHAGVKTNRHS